VAGLRVMIGLPWEQHVAFLDKRSRAQRIVREVRENVRALAGHPAVLCYAIGNEIPASVVRWYGKARIERFIRRLFDAAKSEDPGVLVTYANFPTTEYLDLLFLDFVSFNVYLETQTKLSSYLARLQNLAGERPLVMTELGLDSRRNGEVGQAESLEWQIATAFEGGCAGTFVFAWTDEWFRGGQEISDWHFGLTTRDRQPKKALSAVASRYANIPFPAGRSWPRVTVVVCSYNGGRTIAQTLSALENIDYPDYEVIVIDDGSTDETNTIVGQYAVRLIRTGNNGLSAARNVGLHAATGEIVAYIDDDAYPDRHWLSYLASAFLRTDHVGIGGPNLSPATPDPIANCVANAPGGPVHVLLSDEVAEHIPGCNMAYRRDRLLEIGGFDLRFRVAGDDVDVCWRMQARGWTLGFAPTAVVWHHRRKSISAYLKQQYGYAKAEALLADKWPEKYNNLGHLTWQGRLYGRAVVDSLFQRSKIYHGVWGSAPFQSVYEPSLGGWSSLTLMPEWYFLLACVGCLSALGTLWTPLAWFGPLFAVGGLLTLAQTVRGARRASFDPEPRSSLRRFALQSVVTLLHLVQPATRLIARMQHGLRLWNWRGFVRVVPVPTVYSLWSERWEPIQSRLCKLEAILKEDGAEVARGGDFERWDLRVRGGVFGGIHVLTMVEEHGAGRQLCRFRTWPRTPAASLAALLALLMFTGLAALDRAFMAAALLGLTAGGLAFLIYVDCAFAVRDWRGALDIYLRDGDLRLLTASGLSGQAHRTSKATSAKGLASRSCPKKPAAPRKGL
jgi:GT2 family glycosyltransferase